MWVFHDSSYPSMLSPSAHALNAPQPSQLLSISLRLSYPVLVDTLPPPHASSQHLLRPCHACRLGSLPDSTHSFKLATHAGTLRHAVETICSLCSRPAFPPHARSQMSAPPDHTRVSHLKNKNASLGYLVHALFAAMCSQIFDILQSLHLSVLLPCLHKLDPPYSLHLH